MPEILLLGTFHFLEESAIDFYSSEKQYELEILTRKLALFDPDAIALEAAVHAQSDIDHAYEKFNLSDLSDRNKMQSETLGNISMYGSCFPITYNNESIQIGYRLGKMLNHQKVYAIDDDTILNMDKLRTAAPPNVGEATRKLKSYEKNYNPQTMLDQYKCVNSEEWSRLNQDFYMQVNSVCRDDDYIGAEIVAKWYERNLKIFSNLQRLAVKYKRIFVLYGAGHLQILRDLINADSHLKLVDVQAYLQTTTEHHMKLCAGPFEKIKSGEKTIELRLWDEKRRNINTGDTIVFTNTTNGERLQTTVLRLHRFDSFDALYAALPLLQCGYTEEDIGTAQASDMDAYYSPEEQAEYGVVGIELSVIQDRRIL